MSTLSWDQELFSVLPASAADAQPKRIPLGEQTEREVIRLAQAGDAAAFEYSTRNTVGASTPFACA